MNTKVSLAIAAGAGVLGFAAGTWSGSPAAVQAAASAKPAPHAEQRTPDHRTCPEVTVTPPEPQPVQSRRTPELNPMAEAASSRRGAESAFTQVANAEDLPAFLRHTRLLDPTREFLYARAVPPSASLDARLARLAGAWSGTLTPEGEAPSTAKLEFLAKRTQNSQYQGDISLTVETGRSQGMTSSGGTLTFLSLHGPTTAVIAAVVDKRLQLYFHEELDLVVGHVYKFDDTLPPPNQYEHQGRLILSRAATPPAAP